MTVTMLQLPCQTSDVPGVVVQFTDPLSGMLVSCTMVIDILDDEDNVWWECRVASGEAGGFVECDAPMLDRFRDWKHSFIFHTLKASCSDAILQAGFPIEYDLNEGSPEDEEDVGLVAQWRSGPVPGYHL